MKLHILTLTWNAVDKLSQLRNSLLPALEGIDYHWYIKDNGSKDNTVAVASDWGDKVTCYAYHNNMQNFSAGMNYLFDKAQPNDEDLVLLLNNDVIFNDHKSLHHMIDIITKDSEVGVVGARLLFTGTNKLQHAGVTFDARSRCPSHFRTQEESDSSAEKNRLFQVVTGAVLLTKAKYYRQVCTTNKSGINGLNEGYHWAFDDVDLCLSIHYNMGKKIVYCGKTHIFHEESASLKKVPTNRLFMPHNLKLLKSTWDAKIKIDHDQYKKEVKYNLY